MSVFGLSICLLQTLPEGLRSYLPCDGDYRAYLSSYQNLQSEKGLIFVRLSVLLF